MPVIVRVVLSIVAVSFVGLAVCLIIICCGIFCLRRSEQTDWHQCFNYFLDRFSSCLC